MRTVRRNMRRMFYSLPTSETPVYQRDEDGNILYYEDSDGNRYPLESGETVSGYADPVEFHGFFAVTGGYAEAQEYGLSTADYDAVVIIPNGLIPAAENVLIWQSSEVLYKGDEIPMVDEKSADFRIVRISDGLNITKLILRKNK